MKSYAVFSREHFYENSKNVKEIYPADSSTTEYMYETEDYTESVMVYPSLEEAVAAFSAA